jgi:hypothetical protein
MRIISLDCETNGLMGDAFAVAATLTVDGVEHDQLVMRCPISGAVDPWVVENVLPAIADVELTHKDLEDMLEEWRRWYSSARRPTDPTTRTIGHIIWPVEARFLLTAHGPYDGPYPLIDVAGLLDGVGEDPTSVDMYLRAHGIDPPAGQPHHPLYDARSATLAYQHLIAHAHPQADAGRP